MKFKIIGAVSALALLVAVTAYTEANAASETAPAISAATSASIENAKVEVKQGWDTTKAAVTGAAQDAKTASQQAYENFKARVIDETTPEADITINTRMTAKGMIGQPVYNTKNDKIGTLKDIILDNTGKATMAVVSDGGFMGIGDKLAAFDYALVMQQNADGDVIMPLNEETVGKVSAFSYDPKEASDTVHVLPADGYSVAELLKGKLIDPRSATMGSIENITFSGGEAARVIVAFDQKLNVGGERAALDFDDLTLARQENGALDFRMNERQSAQFEQYKNTKTN